MKKVIITTLIIMSFLFSCSTLIPLRSLDEVPNYIIEDAKEIKVFLLGQNANLSDYQFISQISAYSCKHLITDPPSSTGDALYRLKIEAAYINADAIIDVTFDTRGTDALGTNCWDSVYASGNAVSLSN